MQEDCSPKSDAVPELPDDLNAFARQLASFEARSIAVNRDQLMFEAGQAAARIERPTAGSASGRTLRLWQSAALMLAAVSAGLGTTVAFRPEPETRVVFVEHDQPQNQFNELLPLTNGQAPLATARDSQTPATVRETSRVVTPGASAPDSMVSNLHASEALHARQSFIDHFLDSDFGSDRSSAETDAPSTFADLSPSEPPLTSRSLMMGDKSRIWINRLIEEPKL